MPHQEIQKLIARLLVCVDGLIAVRGSASLLTVQESFQGSTGGLHRLRASGITPFAPPSNVGCTNPAKRNA